MTRHRSAFVSYLPNYVLLHTCRCKRGEAASFSVISFCFSKLIQPCFSRSSFLFSSTCFLFLYFSYRFFYSILIGWPNYYSFSSFVAVCIGCVWFFNILLVVLVVLFLRHLIFFLCLQTLSCIIVIIGGITPR